MPIVPKPPLWRELAGGPLIGEPRETILMIPQMASKSTDYMRPLGPVTVPPQQVRKRGYGSSKSRRTRAYPKPKAVQAESYSPLMTGDAYDKSVGYYSGEEVAQIHEAARVAGMSVDEWKRAVIRLALKGPPW